MYLCEVCVKEHQGHINCESILNILTKHFNQWRALIEKMEEIKKKFLLNLEQYDKMIMKLKKEKF